MHLPHKLTSAFLVVATCAALCGCSLWSTLTGDDTNAAAVAAAQVALATYVDGYQPAVIAYGSLETCSDTVTVNCKTAATLTKLKAIDAKVAPVIAALNTVLKKVQASSVDDLDDDTVSTITADTSTITAASNEISAAGITASTSSN